MTTLFNEFQEDQSGSIQQAANTKILSEEVIALLEERLVVNSDRRKVGEIVVRKEIETSIVEVPVRREKLIVEQVSPDYKQIAVIELGQSNVTEIALAAMGNSGKTLTVDQEIEPKDAHTVYGSFNSIKSVSDLLDAIARDQNHNCEAIRIEITLKDSKNQEVYQDWFDRCGNQKT